MFWRKCLNYVVIAVPADGLAPIGARPSAGTAMMKFIYIYIDPWLSLEALEHSMTKHQIGNNLRDNLPLNVMMPYYQYRNSHY